ncbi:MAG: hypothetical protein AAGC81_19130 [Pseudomonadota bacterium]
MTTPPFQFSNTVERAVLTMTVVCEARERAVCAVVEQIAIRAAAISGGATLQHVVGLWAADAELNRDRYRGPFELTDGMRIEIAVLPGRLEELYAALKTITAEECARFELPAQWIHTDIDINGRRIAAHFQIGAD